MLSVRWLSVLSVCNVGVLATIHQRHRQDRQTGQRTDSIGRTVLQTVAQKQIWHKVASPPHTDSSVMFVRWRKYAPLRTLCWRVYRTVLNCSPSTSAPYRFCPLLSRYGHIDRGLVPVSAVRHLDFKKNYFCPSLGLRGSKMRHRVEFYGNSSNHCWILAI